MKTNRQLRKGRGWTQFDLALRVGVQPQAVYLWESGRRIPQVSQLRKLGLLFGICSDEIALEPGGEAGIAMPRQARANRQHGNPIPGHDLNGRSVNRGRKTSATGRDYP